MILDDFGSGRLSDYVKDMLAYIVDQIYLATKPQVIFTSNLSPEQLAESIDDRTTSRICEMCEVVKIDGQDKRLSRSSAAEEAVQ